MFRLTCVPNDECGESAGCVVRSFIECRKGHMALMFGLLSLPIFGATGMAVDYTRANNVRAFLQSHADNAALEAVQLGVNGDHSRMVEHLRAQANARFGDGWLQALNIETDWYGTNRLEVRAQAKVPVTLLAAVPGMPKEVAVGVAATARVSEPAFIYTEPEVSELDYEAGDYNRVSVYCFDYAKYKATGDRAGSRSTPIAIADNYNSSAFTYEMPRCDAGQVMSYKLLNVRHVRAEPNRWHSSASTRFEFYSDSRIGENGAEVYDFACQGTSHCNAPPFQGWNILETVLCDTRAQCRPQSQGGIIPEGRDRVPQQATRGCEPGKFMYYGWEDRPPGMPGHQNTGGNWQHVAWTDRDYDDIRIVIACPRLEEVGERKVTLVR
jgi:Flp pilus assembly protein TadG